MLIHSIKQKVFFHHPIISKASLEEGTIPISSEGSLGSIASAKPNPQEPALDIIVTDSLESTSREVLKKRGFSDEPARIIFDEVFKSVERMTEPPTNVKDEVKKVISITKPLTLRNGVIRVIPTCVLLLTADGIHLYSKIQNGRDLKFATAQALINALAITSAVYLFTQVRGAYVPPLLIGKLFGKGIYIKTSKEDEADSIIKKDPQKEFERQLRHTTSHEISHYYFFCRNNVQNAFAITRTLEEGLRPYDEEIPGKIIAFFEDEEVNLKDLNEGLIANAMDNSFVGLKKLIRHVLPEPFWTYDYGEALGKHLLVLSGGDYKKIYKTLRLMGKNTPFELAVKNASGLETINDKDFTDHVLKAVKDFLLMPPVKQVISRTKVID